MKAKAINNEDFLSERGIYYLYAIISTVRAVYLRQLWASAPLPANRYQPAERRPGVDREVVCNGVSKSGIQKILALSNNDSYLDGMNGALFNETVENLKKLDYDERVYIRDICERLIEDESRSEFIAELRAGQAESKTGNLKKYSDLNELRSALNAD